MFWTQPVEQTQQANGAHVFTAPYVMRTGHGAMGVQTVVFAPKQIFCTGQMVTPPVHVQKILPTQVHAIVLLNPGGAI
jgi:hypothetical protein